MGTGGSDFGKTHPSGEGSLCGVIVMVQAQCNGVSSSIWELYKVCCITGQQWFGSQDWWLVAMVLQKPDPSDMVSGEL